MQTNYKESPIIGTKWRRAFHVDIRNPLEGEKGVTFHAEDCVTLESRCRHLRGARSQHRRKRPNLWLLQRPPLQPHRARSTNPALANRSH